MTQMNASTKAVNGTHIAGVFLQRERVPLLALGTPWPTDELPGFKVSWTSWTTMPIRQANGAAGSSRIRCGKKQGRYRVLRKDSRISGQAAGVATSENEKRRNSNPLESGFKQAGLGRNLSW